MANPFEIDSSSFYKPTQSGAAKKSVTPVEDDFNYYQQQIDEIMEKTLESSNRGVNMLVESEEIGIATAQDLVLQGEKLQKVENQLDQINTTAKQSQKHINNINSIFGGFFRNMFTKSSKSPPEQAKNQSSSSSSSVPNKLSDTVDKINKQSDKDYYGSDSQMRKIDSSLSDSSRATLAGTKWEVMNDKVDENLDAMHANIARIRQLGLALGGELESQNSALDRISGKAEKADVEIRHQDQQMKKILGYAKNKDKQSQVAEQSGQQSSSAVVEKSPPFIFKKK